MNADLKSIMVMGFSVFFRAILITLVTGGVVGYLSGWDNTLLIIFTAIAFHLGISESPQDIPYSPRKTIIMTMLIGLVGIVFGGPLYLIGVEMRYIYIITLILSFPLIIWFLGTIYIKTRAGTQIPN